MGSSYKISCKKCNYTKCFKIGIGMMYSPQNLGDFESKFAILPHLIRSRTVIAYIKKLMRDRGAEIADGYGHKIYRCKKCGEFYERFFIHLDYDGESFEVDYKCTKCKSVLEIIDYDIKGRCGGQENEMDFAKYRCPKCGEHSLYKERAMMTMWD